MPHRRPAFCGRQPSAELGACGGGSSRVFDPFFRGICVIGRQPAIRGPRREAALDGLARLLKGPRQVVARAFDELISEQGGAASLEAIAGGVASDTEAYARAFHRADADGLLKDFCVRLMRAD